MATIQDLAKSFRRIIREELLMAPDSVRPANQDLGVGAKPVSFATVHFTAQDNGSTSKPDRTYTDDASPALTVTELLQEMQLFDVSVQFFRTDALLLAHKLRMRFHSELMLFKLNGAGLGFVSATPVRDLTALEDQGYEERAQFTVQLNGIAEQTNTLTTIGSIPLAYLQDEPNRSTTHNPEIQTP